MFAMELAAFLGLEDKCIFKLDDKRLSCIGIHSLHMMCGHSGDWEALSMAGAQR
jgi:hypothetical protein